MQIIWKTLPQDIQAVTTLIEAHKHSKIYQNRLQKNITEYPQGIVSQSEFWQAMLMGLLTTQQKSGEGSAVNSFLEIIPHPLRLDCCLNSTDLKALAIHELNRQNGIRRYDMIAEQIERNLKNLQDRRWGILTQINEAIPLRTKKTEREVAREVAKTLHGIGPKQSRNMLQYLSLTRYEIPLDSRVMKWLNQYNILPHTIKSSSLADPNYYELILDGIQILCAEAEVLPCLFDAAVFSWGEKKGIL
jgi:hypothetical protein